MQADVYEYLKSDSNTELFVVKDEKEARFAYNAASFLGFKAFLLPDFRAERGDDLRSFKDELFLLFSALTAYFEEKEKKLLISPVRTLCNPLPKPSYFKREKIEFASTLDLKAFKDKLYSWGYTFVDIVEERGEVSFRGDIVDIYSIDAKNPVRISLFDDEVESIREFVCETQKSFKNELESFSYIPAFLALSKEEHNLLSKRCENLKSDSFVKDIASLGLWAFEDTIYYTKMFTSKIVSNLTDELEEIFFFKGEHLREFFDLPRIREAVFYKDIEPVNIKEFIEYHSDKKIKIIAKNEAIIKQNGIEKQSNIEFIFSEIILNVLSDKEVIVSLNKEVSHRKKPRPSIILDELKPGDLVVHENYGIGVFKGLSRLSVLGAVKDFVLLHYQGDDKLLIPVENLSVIDRYISEGGALAVVDKLGKGGFAKIKEKARVKLFEIAKEVVEIAAKRELIKAKKIDTSLAEIALFQNDAGFEYTEDQKKCCEEIFEDLKSGKAMDRLLSGDVGFGKSEVAMNAIFATVKNGFQAAFIAPTTLLSSQHFKSLNERFKKYGLKVAKLDRFVSAREKKETIKGLKEGTIDVCVGTHSLFNVEFKNLALMVLDEEHKFGVKQKEKLKKLKENLHILSMSATPIPRSLNMALSSIKQYSTIMTPPAERKGVRTFVKEYNQKLLKECILRELRRGGQIFYIHNAIASIEEKKVELNSLLPNLKILTLHSKVQASISEKEMLRFEKGEYDLLLSTSIIESGIHLPNVNTIIVENSDNFGMADLHQLRGRVGRGKKLGYCYFLVKDKEKLSDQSKKRLIALESNSFLGSGSVLAYHDLEIRGGGNLMGVAQSGHIKNIGYTLYLKMLEECINSLLNKTAPKKKEIDIKLSVNAYIDSEYVSEDRIRLELYRRLSRCESVNEVYEIEQELYDRFGKIDANTKQFLQIITIKILASLQEIKSLSNYQQNITIVYENGQKIYLKAPSKDDDDIIETILSKMRKK